MALVVESTCQLDPWVVSQGSPGVGNGYAFQYSRLENPMDRGAWWGTVPGITRVRHD